MIKVSFYCPVAEKIQWRFTPQNGGGATAHAYGISRAARIYSVALPALAATFVLDSIGHHIHPNYYSAR